MPLGRVFAELMADLRDRVEVSWHEGTWHVTAGSFQSALDYVDTSFDGATVLARRDHGRRWPRVTLEVSTDPALAKGAPPLTELAHPAEPAPPPPVGSPTEPIEPQSVESQSVEPEPVATSGLPTDLEAIFADQNDLRRR